MMSWTTLDLCNLNWPSGGGFLLAYSMDMWDSQVSISDIYWLLLVGGNGIPTPLKNIKSVGMIIPDIQS